MHLWLIDSIKYELKSYSDSTKCNVEENCKNKLKERIRNMKYVQ